jgi:hypothetical protein
MRRLLLVRISAYKLILKGIDSNMTQNVKHKKAYYIKFRTFCRIAAMHVNDVAASLVDYQ